MSDQRRRRPWGRDRPIYLGKKCQECGLFSSKTFYCAKARKVLSGEKDACESFRFRHGIWGKRTRKYF